MTGWRQTPPPRFPFHDPTEALEALLEGTYWPRLARYADHMRAWLATERPALGVRHDSEQEAA